jgi:mannosyltransferase
MAVGAKARVDSEGGSVGRLLSRAGALLLPGRLIWLVVLIGGLLRLYRYDALSLWVDEGLTAGFGRLPWDTVLGLHGAYETHPPLYFALVKVAGLIAPELAAGRLVSVLSGTLTLPILYALGLRLIGRWGALIAAGVLALSPLHIWYSQEARPYAFSMLVICGGYFALAGFHKSRRRIWAGFYGATVMLALYADYSTIYALTPQGVLLIYLLLAHGKQALWMCYGGIIGVIGFLPWLPQLLNTVGGMGQHVESYLGVSAERVGNSMLSIVGAGGQGSYFWGSEPDAWERWAGWQAAMLAVIVLVWIVGMAALWKRGLFSLLSGICLFAGTIVVGVGISLISAGYAERTVIYALLGWALVAGAAPVAAMSRRWRWTGTIGVVAVSFLALASLWAIYRGGDKQHWRDLARDSREVARSGELLLLYPDVTGVLLDAYQPGAFDNATVIADFGDLPEVARPKAGAGSLWLAYIETGGLDHLQEQLGERGYRRVEHRYYWNPMWLDHYEADP